MNDEVVDAVLGLIEKDPHQWSIRPCPTCSAISFLIGREFGCSAKWREKSAKET